MLSHSALAEHKRKASSKGHVPAVPKGARGGGEVFGEGRQVTYIARLLTHSLVIPRALPLDSDRLGAVVWISTKLFWSLWERQSWQS